MLLQRSGTSRRSRWPEASTGDSRAAHAVHLDPFALSLPKGSRGLRQAQSERIWHLNELYCVRSSLPLLRAKSPLHKPRSARQSEQGGVCRLRRHAGLGWAGQAGRQAILTACKFPQTPRCPRRHLPTHFNVLHIQELFPHYSIGLQPDLHLKKGPKIVFFSSFSRPKGRWRACEVH